MKTYCVTLEVEKTYQSNVEADSLIEAYAKGLDEWEEELSEKDLDHLDIQAEEVVDDEWDWVYSNPVGKEEI